MTEYIIASDWPWGVEAILNGCELLRAGYSALDAVEASVRIVEDDPNVNSVGTGGLPNVEGVLELEACIMDGTNLMAGAVTCLEMTKNPISVARKVMELTPHVLLAGENAIRFARKCGFPVYNPLTPNARDTWKKLREVVFSEEIDESASDAFYELTGYRTNFNALATSLRSMFGKSQGGTVGVLATDLIGNIAAGTSTSGRALRFPGTVSDSAIVGAGNYANRVSAASATGVGETAIKHCLTKRVCDLVEDGLSPENACKTALSKILRNETINHQIAVICIDIRNNVGGACTKDGFQFEYMTSHTPNPIIVYPEPVVPSTVN